MGPEALIDFPFERFSASSRVDLRRLSASVTNAIRLRASDAKAERALSAWCESARLAVVIDDQGYAVVARSHALADQVMAVDRSSEPHAQALGRAFGYPPCCALAIADIGESRIDERAREAASWEFPPGFGLVDPAGYSEGLSLVSHVPCGAACQRSLKLAVQLLWQLPLLETLPGHRELLSWVRERSGQPGVDSYAGLLETPCKTVDGLCP